eukprot:750767_1
MASKIVILLMIGIEIITAQIIANDPKTWTRKEFMQWIEQTEHPNEAVIHPEIKNDYGQPLFYYLKSHSGVPLGIHFRQHPPFPLDETHEADFPINSDKDHPRILFHGRPLNKNPFNEKVIDAINCLTDEGTVDGMADEYNLWTAPMERDNTIEYVFDYATDLQKMDPVGFIVVFELPNNRDIQVEFFYGQKIHKRCSNHNLLAREHDYTEGQRKTQYKAYILTPEAYKDYQP